MPNARVQFPMAEIRKAVGDAQRDIQAKQTELLDIVGTTILNFAQLDFVKKARGGTGSDGVKWKPLKASTIKRKNRRAGTRAGRSSNASEIGVDTGLLRASVSPGHPDNVLSVNDASVTVGYGREYARYFDEDRPLLPTELPDEWQEAVDQQAAAFGQQIIDDAFGGL